MKFSFVSFSELQVSQLSFQNKRPFILLFSFLTKKENKHWVNYTRFFQD